jgi:hypothetical protein
MTGRLAPGLAILTATCILAAESPRSFDPPMERFVTNRPRLFINARSWPSVSRNASLHQPVLLDQMRTHLRSLATATNPPPGDYGVESAAAAFVFLCEPTSEWLNAATGLLARSVAYYRECDRERRVVNHYAATRIHAITAYDWLYDAMPQEARQRLGSDLLEHVAHRILDRRVPGDNLNDYRSGFYGEICLPWYVGIATRGTGIDESRSSAAIDFGYREQMRMLAYRRRLAGNDGGVASPTLGYALRANPWAEFNFFHTMKSAFDLDIAADWPHVALVPNYVLWNRLPGDLEFGIGDAFHLTNEFPDQHLYTHLAQIRHFYGQSHPEQAALAAWLQGQCGRPSHNPAWPLTPFLLTDLNHAPAPRATPSTLPLSRHFAGIGQIFMRSGWGDDDTYAVFTAGGSTDGIAAHKHYDENHFAIFRKGFLALDTGTRPEPGSHLFQYYCRTVAHNGVTIRMEGEIFPPYWGTPAPGEPVLPVPNDGGMRSQTGAVIRAFRTTADFTYIASDATACYHPGKCRLAVRQFVHIQPNLFVIFDRIQTVKPEQRVTWLLHTAEEPRVEDDHFIADQGGGRLWCRTLFPRKAVFAKVGGPGREFWSDGRNWPLPATPWLGGERIERRELLGGWRVEVAPSEPATDVILLHLIEAGDRHAKTKVTPVRRLWGWNRVGVKFKSGSRTISVRFRKRGEISGEIRIEQKGSRRITEILGNTVQPQSEWVTTGR